MPPYILKLPLELIFCIFNYLDVEDAFQLGMVCKHFYSAICNDNLCRELLQLNAPYSPEYLAAHETANWHRAFCILVKRKQAIRNADPFAVGIVAVADRYLYVNGTLVYRNEETLRVLSLRGCVATESVIDIRCLLNEHVPESREIDKFLLIPLHYADGIVACRYMHVREGIKENWLLLADIHRHEVSAHRLATAYRIFVRCNSRHLVYGTYTVEAADGYRRWVLRQYSFEKHCWAEQSICLDDFVGSAMGSDIFITIIDDYFYALAKQTSLEPSSTARSSYYYCCRFRLGWRENSERNADADSDADDGELQVATVASSWRRENCEGPIDDRWTFLRLEKHERTGDIMAVELRKEWRCGVDAARRTYYLQKLDFLPKRKATKEGANAAENGDSGVLWLHGEGPSHISAQDYQHPGYSEYGHNGEMYAAHPYRQPDNVHPELDSNVTGTPLLTLNNCLFLNYFTTASAPIKMLNIPSHAEPKVQNIVLSISTRMLRRGAEHYGDKSLSAGSAYCTLPAPNSPAASSFSTSSPYSLGSDQDALYPNELIEKKYVSCQPKLWPSEEPKDWRQQELHTILNPPGHHGQIEATSDEHLLLYQTGGADGSMKALVVVSFDPSLCLVGLRHWAGGRVRGSLPARENKAKEKETMTGPHIVANGVDQARFNSGEIPESYVSPLAGTGSGTGNTADTASAALKSNRPASESWLKQAKPMFREIDRGFHFAL